MAPIATFYRLACSALMPMRADRSALGTLPTAALQYCEAITSASAFGWYAFPPIDFHVQYDGTNFIWTHDQAEAQVSAAQRAPSALRGLFRCERARRHEGIRAPVSYRPSQPGVLGLVGRHDADAAGLEHANPAACEHGAKPRLRAVRRHHRDRPVVLSVVSQHSDHGYRSTDLFDRHRPLLQTQPLRRGRPTTGASCARPRFSTVSML